MAFFVKLDQSDCVESAFQGINSPEETFLEVVVGLPTQVPQPDQEIVDEEGTVVLVPQDPLEVPFVAETGTVGITVPITLRKASCMMRSGDLLVPRPSSPMPYVDASNNIVVPPCPAGTVISIFDLSGSELMTEVIAEEDDFEEQIAFSTPGTYCVEVEAPTPHLQTRAEVTIQ